MFSAAERGYVFSPVGGTQFHRGSPGQGETSDLMGRAARCQGRRARSQRRPTEFSACATSRSVGRVQRHVGMVLHWSTVAKALSAFDSWRFRSDRSALWRCSPRRWVWWR